MVGVGDLVDLAAWLDPVTTVLVGAAILIYIRKVLKPRVKDLEDTQDERGDRLNNHELDSQEQALLIDDNAERVDQVEDAVGRLKKRVRRLEQNFAAEHNRPPRTRRDGGDPSTPDDAAAESADGTDDPGADGDDQSQADDADVVDQQAEDVTQRLRKRAGRIREGLPSADPRDHHQQRRTPRGDD